MTMEPPNPPDSGEPTQPPAPPPPPLVPSPGGSQPFNLSEAFNYGWKKFQENLGPILTAMLILLVGGAILNFVWYLITGGLTSIGLEADGSISTPGFTAYLVTSAVLGVVGALVGFVIQAAIIRGALEITKGVKIDLNTFLKMDNMGQVILAAVILSVATAIGFLLCIIPGVIVIFFSQFTNHFILDKGMPATDAIRASFELVNKNLGSTIGLYLGSIIAFFIGALLCGVGLLVAIPVVIIATAYAYRTMSGEAVAP
jgi:hypothetical protein